MHVLLFFLPPPTQQQAFPRRALLSSHDASWAKPSVATGNHLMGTAAPTRQQEDTMDAIESRVDDDLRTGGRKLQSSDDYMHPSIPHGKSFSFNDGPTATQTSAMSAIESRVAAASDTDD